MNSPIFPSNHLLYVLLGTSAFKKHISYPILISACLVSMCTEMRLFLVVTIGEDIAGSAIHRMKAILRFHWPSLSPGHRHVLLEPQQ